MTSVTATSLSPDSVRQALGRLGVTPEDVASALRRDLPTASAGWLVGSLALGRGNARSDIDAIMVDAVDDDDTARLVPVSAVREQRVDVRCVRPEWVIAMATASRRVAEGRGEPVDEALIETDSQLTLLARIAYGYALPGIDDTRADLEVSQAATTVVLVRADLLRIHRLWLLAELALRAGRDLILVDVATTVVEATLHAALTARFGYVSSPKWIWEHRGDADADLLELARDALAPGHTPAQRWLSAKHLYQTVTGADGPARFMLVAPSSPSRK